MSIIIRAAASAACLVLLVAGHTAAAAPDVAKPDPAAKLPPAPRATADKSQANASSDVQRQFCLNNATSASDARLAWQAAQLGELEARLKQRIADLEAKRAEYVDWVRKRDEAMSKAADNVVVIYAKMKPDAAALQIAAMDDAMAAALLAKLSPRNASTILNEMEPGRAARLTNAMVGPTGSDKKKT